MVAASSHGGGSQGPGSHEEATKMPRATPAPPRTGGQRDQAPTDLGAAPRPELRGLAGVAGQDAVVGILRSALQGGRPHHAYLFDGPEGVGKATCARALFAALNCLAPPAVGDACGRAPRARSSAT